jgi:hypothetical protein
MRIHKTFKCNFFLQRNFLKFWDSKKQFWKELAQTFSLKNLKKYMKSVFYYFKNFHMNTF